MSKSTQSERPVNLVLLRGTVSNLTCNRDYDDFFAKPVDNALMGATAIGAAFAGFAGQAVGLTSLMGTSTAEEYDSVSFEIADQSVQGQLWRFPFAEGDEVEVVAEKTQGPWRVLSAKRMSDNLVSVYPHCTRGRKAHYRATLKYWLYVSSILLIFSSFMFYLANASLEESVLWSSIPVWLFIVFFIVIYGLVFLIAIPIALRFMPFARLAHMIFETYGWPEPGNIDLRKSAKKDKRSGDPDKYGLFLFRYTVEALHQ